MCHENVYAAQFLFVGNPYESTFFAYIPRYVEIPSGKCLVLPPIRDRLSFLDESRKSVRSTFFVCGQPLCEHNFYCRFLVKALRPLLRSLRSLRSPQPAFGRLGAWASLKKLLVKALLILINFEEVYLINSCLIFDGSFHVSRDS